MKNYHDINQLYGWDLDLSFLKNNDYLIGIDEVGRGCLAGPVVSCAVSLINNPIIDGLNDSKKLTPKKREQFFSTIYKNANYIGIGVALTSEIDAINIYQATLKSMLRSIKSLPSYFNPTNTTILIDAMPLKKEPYKIVPIIKGDSKSPHIMAASIVAKVVRDHLMEQFHLIYPQYGFHQHKGYGTQLHTKMIIEHGITPIHRKSFAPINKIG